MLTETLGHTRMLHRPVVGAAHWFVFVAFGALFLTLITAYGQLFDPRFVLPVIGHWLVYEWAAELIAWAGLVAIVYLIGLAWVVFLVERAAHRIEAGRVRPRRSATKDAAPAVVIGGGR